MILSIIDYKNYPKINADKTREYTWLDQKYVKIPDVIGMNLKEAKNVLKSFSIEYSGTGETIIEQSPDGNTFIKENSIVKLMLN